MYSKRSTVGNKIKTIAQILGVLCAVIEGIASLIYFADEEPVIGLVFLVFAISSVIVACLMYGFGQLIDDVSAIRGKLEETVVPSDELPEL